jgi:hydrogenase maturation protein HypF
VLIDVEGETSVIDALQQLLVDEAPPLARVTSVTSEVVDLADGGEARTGFAIVESDAAGAPSAPVSIDTATCDDCLAEVLDPHDRRHRYPFTNCTNCGPRYTIVRRVPYDRPWTTMADFAMCEDCLREYHAPTNRRFHAQPNACRVCGPQLAWHDLGSGQRAARDEALAAAVGALRAAKVVGVKGIGGYHLAVDATDAHAVAELRRRKERDDKPFAVMVADLDAADEVVELGPEARRELTSVRRPIVLARRRDADAIAQAVAPGLPELGVMLPYTPLHHLIARAFQRPIVLTSANVTDEPIAFRDDDSRLPALADAIVSHDRAIFVGCDDSVARVIADRPTLVRRSRGHAPHARALPHALAHPTLATGGHLKSVFALGDATRATLSHHLGDLDDADAFAAYARMVAHYERLHDLAPVRAVHDAHPDYATTRYTATRGLPAIAVQHHHAHFAGCLADNAFTGRALGIICDGAGHGSDGASWGGEIFLGDAAHVERVGHLRYVALPGGDAAAREPWRMALVHLLDAGCPIDRVDHPHAQPMRALIADPRTPRTSSVGRLFDAAGFLIANIARNTHEAAAAMHVEALAAAAPHDRAIALPFAGGELDTRPLIAHLHAGTADAALFHNSLAEGFAAACANVAPADVRHVALSGGVFVNDYFTRALVDRLARRGFTALRHRDVPPNDGGLAYGQLAVVAARDAR